MESMNFISAKELLFLCSKQDKSISQVMVEREMEVFGVSEEEIYERLSHSYDIMKHAVQKALEGNCVSMKGLIGGEAKKVIEMKEQPTSLLDGVSAKALAYALGVLEVNASMGLIVAAPTAGASGVIPGSFIAIQEEFGYSDKQMLDALLNASAIGYLITRNANVSGALGGCQAEVGSASAMAASAIVELQGGTPKQCMSAAVSALMNLLGLVCDPIGGLVEVPCQQRNGIGATNALISAQIALAGVSNIVPLDEMIEAMHKVGLSLPMELRETGLGGTAGTLSACQRCGKC